MAPMMSQQEAIFGQKQLTGKSTGSLSNLGSGQLPTDIFQGVGGLPQEEEKKLEISDNHYQDTVNSANQNENQEGYFSQFTSMLGMGGGQ